MHINRDFRHFLEIEANAYFPAVKTSQQTVVIALTTTEPVALGIIGHTRYQCRVDKAHIRKPLTDRLLDMKGTLT